MTAVTAVAIWKRPHTNEILTDNSNAYHSPKVAAGTTIVVSPGKKITIAGHVNKFCGESTEGAYQFFKMFNLFARAIKELVGANQVVSGIAKLAANGKSCLGYTRVISTVYTVAANATEVPNTFDKGVKKVKEFFDMISTVLFSWGTTAEFVGAAAGPAVFLGNCFDAGVDVLTLVQQGKEGHENSGKIAEIERCKEQTVDPRFLKVYREKRILNILKTCAKIAALVTVTFAILATIFTAPPLLVIGLGIVQLAFTFAHYFFKNTRPYDVYVEKHPNSSVSSSPSRLEGRESVRATA